MIKTVHINDYINTALSIDDASTIAPIIQHELSKLNSNDILQCDFTDVKYFTPSFFNRAFMNLLESLTIEQYHNMIQLVNLSKIGQMAYNYSLENAKNWINTHYNNHTANTGNNNQIDNDSNKQ